MRYLIEFSYDGTNYSGYQKQPGLNTIQECLEDALYNINNHKNTDIVSSGRTDKGVHAFMQTGHFDLDINITLYKLKKALNSNLPADIHVISTEIVDNDFHARFNVKQKTYEYYINIGEYNPIDRNHIYQYNKEINIDKMKEGIKYFIGEHNFKNFTSNETKKPTYVRKIYKANISIKNNIIKFSFTGNGFMKYQVRNMVGTLLKVGENKQEPIEIKKILETVSGSDKVYTIKPNGLYLKEVKY